MKRSRRCRESLTPIDLEVRGGPSDRSHRQEADMNTTPQAYESSCHCGRPATHLVSNGIVTLRTCYLHARKAAIALRTATH